MHAIQGTGEETVQRVEGERTRLNAPRMERKGERRRADIRRENILRSRVFQFNQLPKRF